MKFFQAALAASLASMCLAGTAHAELAVTASVGSTGLGAHLTIPVQPGFNARIGFNAASYNFADKSSAIDYEYKLKLRTVEVLADWYPMAGAFHLTGGVAYNGNEITGQGRPQADGSYVVNGNNYTSGAGTIDGKISFRKAVPYLGIGWGNPLSQERGWGFSSDLGVLFQGAPTSSLASTNCTLATALCSRLASDLSAERSKRDEDLKMFKAYPVLRIGASYTF